MRICRDGTWTEYSDEELGPSLKDKRSCEFCGGEWAIFCQSAYVGEDGLVHKDGFTSGVMTHTEECMSLREERKAQAFDEETRLIIRKHTRWE